MNFHVMPFAGPVRQALFRPRLEDIREFAPHEVNESLFVPRDVMGVLSTQAGHFLLVLSGEELKTVRDVCKSEGWECLGVFAPQQIPSVIEASLDDLRTGKIERRRFQWTI
jgi:hypothetical protein